MGEGWSEGGRGLFPSEEKENAPRPNPLPERWSAGAPERLRTLHVCGIVIALVILTIYWMWKFGKWTNQMEAIGVASAVERWANGDGDNKVTL
jgi:hypothetical protein